MRLTQQNASQFVDKSLFGGPFHYWPLRIIRHKNGLYYYAEMSALFDSMQQSSE